MSKFTTWDGLELNYTVWEGDGAHPPVVLQHGIVADTNANWISTGVVAALRAAGHTVVSLDARGHGRSEKPHDQSQYSWPAMAQDIRGVFDELALEEVSLVGYSMGAVLSILVAGSDSRVTRLSVGGVGSGVVDCGGIDTRVIDGSLIARAMAGDPPGADQIGAQFRVLADAVGADRHAIRAVALGLMSGDEPVRDLDALTIPTLVIAGDADPFAAEPHRLAAAITNAELLVVPGDHLMAVMAPEYSARLVEFLA